jgi:hypothetical protein
MSVSASIVTQLHMWPMVPVVTDSDGTVTTKSIEEPVFMKTSLNVVSISYAARAGDVACGCNAHRPRQAMEGADPQTKQRGVVWPCSIARAHTYPLPGYVL